MKVIRRYLLKVSRMQGTHCHRGVEGAQIGAGSRPAKYVSGREEVRVAYLRKEAKVVGEAFPEGRLKALGVVGYPAQVLGEEKVWHTI